MKAIIKAGQVTVEVESDSTTDLFQSIADAQEVFGDQQCGLCASSNLRFVVRNASGYTFREMECQACRAKLAFGQAKADGKLFPIRKLTQEGKPSFKDGQYGAHNGWTKYRGPNQQGDF